MSRDLEQRRARLVAKLQKAVVLELSTLPPYLTALWSIRPGTNLQAAAIIRSVLMEEMLHMTLAANVLSAIGGAVRLDGPALPVYPLPLEFDGHRGSRLIDMHVERFSVTAIDTFIQLEFPENLPVPPGSRHAGMAPGEQVRRKVRASELAIPDLSVGEFYAHIIAEMRTLSTEFGDAAVFQGDPRHQISEEFYWKGGGHPIVVDGFARAEEALKVITEQGEGADGSLFDGDRHFFGQPDEIAHYFRFKQIAAGRYYARTDSIHDSPSGAELPVDYGAVFPIKPDCKQAEFAADARLSTLSAKFNAGYTMMLWQLMEGFGGNPAVFYTAIMNGMTGLSEVARILVQTPIPGDPQHRTAAPTFEWNAAGFGL